MKESINLLLESKGHRLKALLVKIDIETHWSKIIKWKVLSEFKNVTFKLGWHRGLYIRPCIIAGTFFYAKLLLLKKGVTL